MTRSPEVLVLWLLLMSPVEAKPPGVLKALAGAYDPLTGPRATLDAIRAQQPALGPVDGPLTFAAAATAVLPLFPADERARVLTEALTLLDAAAAADPSRRAEIEAARGGAHAAVGDATTAQAAYRASMAAGPSLAALGPLLDLAPAEAPALCAATRPAVSPQSVGPLVEACHRRGDPLAWASPADREAWASWREASARADAELAARHAREQAALSASFSAPAPSPAPSSAAPAPSGPVVTSVSLRSSCRETVRVFFGKEPKYGSGSTQTISANSISSFQMKPGDTIWIVDGSDNGLSSTTVGGASQTIEILPSCTGFTVR